jgi:hypothetical protein
MNPLFSESALNAARVWAVWAVNNSGEFVGGRTLPNSVGQFIPKAYRGRQSGSEITASDFLVPPFQQDVNMANVPSEALTITERNEAKSGVAAGWAGKELDGNWIQRPAVWWSRTNGFPEPTNAFWVPIAGELQTSTGQVNAIRQDGVLYGWVQMSPQTARRAARWENGWTANTFLDDKFEAYGFSDVWDLEELVDATGSDVILGNGKKNGAARAFLLIPQTTAN